MISLFGFNFGFLLPVFLAALPIGITALIYAYRKRGKGERVVVASLLLLKQLKRVSNSPRNFVPPLRFFFELLLLFGLILAASGLFQEKQSLKIALLIDNSLSMGVRDYESGKVVFEEAITKAKAFLEGLESGDEVLLYATGPSLLGLSSHFESPGIAKTRLENLEVKRAKDNLDMALLGISSQGGVEKIIIFSDKTLSPNSSKQTNSRFKLIPLGLNIKERQNVALKKSWIERNKADANLLDVHVEIQPYLNEKAKFLLKLEEINQSKEVTLSGMDIHKEVFVGLPQSFQNLSVRISPISNTPISLDALGNDNTWNLKLVDGRSSILLVGPASVEELGLSELKAFNFEYMSPDMFDKEGVNRDTKRSVIFYRTTPTILPKQNSLFVLPTSRGSIFEVGEAQGPVDITSWNTDHPLTLYLNVAVLHINKFFPLVPPSWGKELLRTTGGVAAWTGIYEGHRYVTIGFEVFPYEGKDSPFLSVLSLNILKWLNKDQISERTEITENFYDQEESNTLQPHTVGLSTVDIFKVANKSRAMLSYAIAFIVFLLVLLDIIFMIIKRLYITRRSFELSRT